VGRSPSSVNDINNIQYQFNLKKDHRRIPANFFKALESFPIQDSFKDLIEFKGLIFEDTQMENFSFAKAKEGNFEFSIRNLNNLTMGHYHNDLLIHLVSIRQVDQQVDWNSYFRSYKKGLLNEPREMSFYIEKEIAVSRKKMEKLFLAKVKIKPPFKFKTKSGSVELENTELDVIKETLLKKFPNLEIYDSYKKYENLGKVENLIAYHLLLRLNPHEEVKWIVLSEDRNQPDLKIKKIVEDYLLTRVQIEKGIYNIFEFQQQGIPIRLNYFHHDEYKDIALDQAYVLGKLHRISLGDKVNDYVSALSKMKSSQMEETVIMLKFKLRDILDGNEN